MHDNPDTLLITAWRSPSNIALTKYWGKHGDQLPDNASISLTLSKAYTETRVTARRPNHGERAGITFHFHGKENKTFAPRISTYVERLYDFVPFAKEYHLLIESENSFPHSSGIASSASAMSALALCLADLQFQLDGKARDALFHQQVSEMSRLGSGSASRSIYAPLCIWGKHPMVADASDSYAMALPDVHPCFQTLRNTILIIDDAMKAMTSSKGHALMQGHPYGKARIIQATENLDQLIPALRDGDMQTAGRIAEAEAMSLHALMMTSDPGYILMLPNTLHVLQRVKAFRDSTGIPVYFTLDAGPNVHLLHLKEHEDQVRNWIFGELSMFCKEGRVIEDYAGTGPEKI